MKGFRYWIKLRPFITNFVKSLVYIDSENSARYTHSQKENTVRETRKRREKSKNKN